MNPQDIVNISNNKSRLEAILELNKTFLEWVSSHSVPQELPSKVQVDQGTLSVSGFGFAATAAARPVRMTTGAFAIEYVFFVHDGEEKIEVSRFYLTDNGRLAADESTSNIGLTDFNNTYIAKFICGRVLLGILSSKLLAPRSVA